MFAFNSAEMLEPEHYIADLTEFLPPLDELDGYLVVVTAYTASGETAEDLAELRTEAVYEMLIDLGLPGSKIRLVADPVSGGSEPYRQRADVYFIYVGNK
jgi:outer membrane protein OmpA-like peptidoglycan-associated protein